MVENESVFSYDINRTMCPIESYEDIPLWDPQRQLLQETNRLKLR